MLYLPPAKSTCYQLLMCSELFARPPPAPPIAPRIWPAAWLCSSDVTAFCVCTRTATRNLAYPYTFDQWNLSHISGNVRASHGWPCWQCTEARRSGTRHCGTASTGVFLANTPSHSGRISNTYSARHLSTPLAPSCPPYYPALAWPCPIAGPLPAS